MLWPDFEPLQLFNQIVNQSTPFKTELCKVRMQVNKRACVVSNRANVCAVQLSALGINCQSPPHIVQE